VVMAIRRDDSSIQALRDDAELFRYVFRPGDPPLESPRPYLHPVRTLTGEIVTDCRPGDHPWHKGISWSLPNVGPDNFWGGPTYRRGDGYIQLDNNGTTRHDAFGEVKADTGQARLAERLTWVSAAGATLFTERRLISATALPDGSGWACAFQSTMRNVSGRPVAIGSPTTEGRDNAGYGGLFWRGPAAFTGGRVLTPDGTGRDDLMGWRGPWLAFATQAATLLFRDSPANPGYPCQWFVRSTPFACVCPGAFFASAVQVAVAAELTLRYDIVIATGELDTAACALLAGREGP
jgi:Methane oxygenase PmoA